MNRKADYSKIKRKLYAYILAAVAAAVVFVVFLRYYIQRQGVVGDWAVAFLEKALRLDYPAALSVYERVIRDNMEIFTCVAVALCFVLSCRVILSRFIRYFDEVHRGIDSLIQEEDAHIACSPEMAFVEDKLSALQRTLAKRRQEARLAEQRKNELVMYLAHDLRTPLTSVIGYLSLLAEAPDMPAEQRAKYLRITLDKAQRLEKLIGEFFEITRYNIQTITLSKTSIDLHYMLVQMTEEFYPQLSAQGRRAALDVAEDLTVYGDPDKLARVFNNIFKNAVAYSPAGGVIQIRAARTEAAVSIVFTNAGAIPREELAAIFDRFYRLDAARSTDTGGAGLGLAVAREIVVLHGGRIYADSDGVQSSFTVELPEPPERSHT